MCTAPPSLKPSRTNFPATCIHKAAICRLTQIYTMCFALPGLPRALPVRRGLPKRVRDHKWRPMPVQCTSPALSDSLSSLY